MTYNNLFSPIRVGKFVLKNRITAAPVGRIELHDDGRIREEYLEWFTQKAKGGAALVTVGESFVDFEYAHREPANYSIDYADRNDPCIVGYGTLARAIKDNGAAALAQLIHAGSGRLPQKGEKDPVGPVEYIREDGVHVYAMDEALMEKTAENFAVCADFMKAAGFDGIHLHAGHGWLFSQFLSPLTNTRTDKYGGSLENRARFPIMIIDRVRERVGPDFLIEIRISGEENVPGGMEIGEAVEFCKMIDGKVDLIQISAGLYREPIISRQFSSGYEHRCCNAGLAAEVKKAVKTPVSTVGGINDPEDAERLIAEGAADMVALGRQMFADPWFPEKARAGRRQDIDMCIRCLWCFGGPMEDQIAEDMKKGREHRTPKAPPCAINPFRIFDVKKLEAPLPEKKRVLVIGGGLAGMAAAYYAALRGHQVCLAEKSGSLGGKLRYADGTVMNGDIKRLVDCYVKRLQNHGVNVLPGRAADRELIQEFSPDAVICAVGSREIIPAIPGTERENVFTASEVCNAAGLKKLGERVAVIGGGATGAEAALYFERNGREVTLIEKGERLASDVNPMASQRLLKELAEKVSCRRESECTEIVPSGVMVKACGKTELIPADSVVLAVGLCPENTEKLSALCPGVPFTKVGDCAGRGSIMKSIHQGAAAAMALEGQKIG